MSDRDRFVPSQDKSQERAIIFCRTSKLFSFLLRASYSPNKYV